MPTLDKQGNVVIDGKIVGKIVFDGAAFVGRTAKKKITSFDLDAVLTWFATV